MNQEQFIRSRMLLGEDCLNKLAQSKVAIFGLGGVGGHCTESLARAGIGCFHLFDDDKVTLSNLNRQLVALHSTIGQLKVEVMKQRILDINPNCQVEAHAMFYTPRILDQVDLSQFDYVVDCVDTVTAKLDLAKQCDTQKIPLISSMGSANKFDPSAFVLTDISKTEGCPLARIMRKELRKRGIKHLKVVYSKEEAKTPERSILPQEIAVESERPGVIGHKLTPGSLPFVPAAAGILLASAVTQDLAGYTP